MSAAMIPNAARATMFPEANRHQVEAGRADDGPGARLPANCPDGTSRRR